MGLAKYFGYEKIKEPVQQEEAYTGESSLRGAQPTNHNAFNRNNWYPVLTEHFDGEKTPGELGAYKDMIPNYRGLRYRVYEAELKSDIVKIITGKFFKFVVGTGLKLQAKPNKKVLELEKINIKKIPEFTSSVEARFNVYSKSRFSDYKGMDNLHLRAEEAFKTAFLGGDCLTVLRVDEKLNINVQVIDGQHVQSPVFDVELMEEIKARNNTLEHGIELSPKGEHVAFYVLVDDGDNLLGKFERIQARGDTSGRLLAWMIYGSKHRIDHHRGISNITPILEKVDKLDRYTEAVVGSAEERAKIAYAVEHNEHSDGENPMMGRARAAAGVSNNADLATSGYDLGEKSAAAIAATTGKQTFNMPIGASLKALSSVTELQFETFSKAVFTFLCAAVEIPVEVALQLYEQNYSSSRAAINAWDHIVKIYREKFSQKFYQPFYDLWLEIEILKNKINADGFVTALQTSNFMVTESYTAAIFTGSSMAHIDPLKEIKAIREMMGDDRTALISREQAAELAGVGDWDKNFEKSLEEEKTIPEPKVEKPIEDNKNGNQKIQK